MRVLVVGSGGQLGTKLMELLSADRRWEVRGVDLPDLDITREAQVHDAVSSYRPSCIVNCAAYTDVERAESEPEAAYLVNAAAVGILADAALRVGARLVHTSTDFVFSGIGRASPPKPYDEDDAPGPISVYGASKLAGEISLQRHGVRSVILRTSWLYGGPGRNFLGTMLKLGEEARRSGKPVRVVNDQWGTPTDAWSLAHQVRRVLESDIRGIVHASCRGEATWYQFAKAIFREAKVEAPVEPVSTGEFPTKARRPAYSVLKKRRLDEAGLNVFPHWEDGVREAIRRLHGHP